MKRHTLLSRHSVSHSKIASWVREMSATKAWALGLGVVGVAALLSITTNPLRNFLTGDDASAGGEIIGLPESDGTLVQAVYAAGMVQDLGTFGAYPTTKSNGGDTNDFTASLTSSGGAGDSVSLFPARRTSGLGASIDFSGQLWGESSLALAASPQAFRSPGAAGGWRGGGAVARQVSGGGSAGQSSSLAGAGANAAGGLPGIETTDPTAASSDDKASVRSNPTIADNSAAALLSDEVFLGSGAGAVVPELLLAETIPGSDSSLAAVDADAVLPSARVPDFAATWALFAAVLASLTFVRRIFA